MDLYLDCIVILERKKKTIGAQVCYYRVVHSYSIYWTQVIALLPMAPKEM